MTGRPAPTEHGTTGYQQYHQCRCQPCFDAVARYRKRLAFEHAGGKTRRVAVAPIREYVTALMEGGATATTIASAAGSTPVQIGRIHRGEISQFVLRSTAEAILAVELQDVLADYRQVPALGVRRRIQALYALGYTKGQIGAAIGYGARYVDDLLSAETVKASNFEKVAAAYNQLSNGSGTYEHNRWLALRRGWPPPLGWEDIDDPNDEPHWEWVRCIGPDCDQHVRQLGLCNTHYQKIQSLGLIGKPGFRRGVLRHCRKTNFSRTSTAEDVAELRELGFTLDGAAARLQKKRAVVQRAWYQQPA